MRVVRAHGEDRHVRKRYSQKGAVEPRQQVERRERAADDEEGDAREGMNRDE